MSSAERYLESSDWMTTGVSVDCDGDSRTKSSGKEKVCGEEYPVSPKTAMKISATAISTAMFPQYQTDNPTTPIF